MNLFNKFSMLKKPNLSYILKLVAGDNSLINQNDLTLPNSGKTSARFLTFPFLLFQLTLYLHTEK